jgi:hypothetical protein
MSRGALRSNVWWLLSITRRVDLGERLIGVKRTLVTDRFRSKKTSTPNVVRRRRNSLSGCGCWIQSKTQIDNLAEPVKGWLCRIHMREICFESCSSLSKKCWKLVILAHAVFHVKRERQLRRSKFQMTMSTVSENAAKRVSLGWGCGCAYSILFILTLKPTSTSTSTPTHTLANLKCHL